MHKFLFTLSLLFATISMVGQGVYNSNKDIYIGVAGAVNLKAIANQNNYGYNELDYAFAPGFHGGFVIGLDVSNRYGFQVEVNFSNMGQSYQDVISGNDNKKSVDLSYYNIPILYRKIMGQNDVYSQYDGTVENFYWVAGIQFGFLSSAEIEWQINDQTTDFLSFINQHGRNPHIDAIRAQGAPSDDREFFNSTDIDAIFGLGWQKYFTKYLQFTAEFRGGIGIVDMNKKEWRYENRNGIYQASRNAFGGLRIGIAYVIK